MGQKAREGKKKGEGKKKRVESAAGFAAPPGSVSVAHYVLLALVQHEVRILMRASAGHSPHVHTVLYLTAVGCAGGPVPAPPTT